MAERRYNFRFSLPEGFVLLLSLLLTSFLVFLFGVHVGKETQARKAIQQGRTVRLPVVLSESEGPSFSQLPAGKSASTLNPTREPSAALETRQNQSSPAPPGRRPLTDTAVSPAAAPQTPANRDSSASAGKILASPIEKKPPTQPAPKGRWSVQVQATQQQSVAQDIARKLREQGYSPVVSKITRQGTTWYRVRVGSFTNEEQARETVTHFRREGSFPQAYPVSE